MEFAINHLNSFGLMALFAAIYGMAIRSSAPRRLTSFCSGILFGGAAMVAMHSPIQIADGTFVDSRNLFIGLAGAFLGPVGAIPSLAIPIAYRLELGGAGAIPGCLSMVISMGAGLTWAWLMRARTCTKPRCLIVLGLLLSTNLLPVLMMPADVMARFLETAGIYIVAFNITGALLFGGLMERERWTLKEFVHLREEANTDPLTGLLNRRGLEQVCARLAKGTSSRPAATLVVDLDHFKNVNDSLGHEAGDSLLVEVAAQVKESIRASDIVGRVGGEEFLVILPETSRQDAWKIAERIREAIRRDLPACEAPSVAVSTSIGGHWAATGLDLLTSIRMADRALYSAKQNGRNRSVFSDKLAA